MSNPPAALSALQSDYLDLTLEVRELLTKKKLIGLCALACMCLSLTYAWLRPAHYSASVLLQVHHQQDSSLGAMNFGHPSAESAEPVAVQIALIKSKFVLSPAIQSLQTELPPGTESQNLAYLRSHLVITDLSEASDVGAKNASILQLSLTGSDPSKTIQVINKIALLTQQKDNERKALEAKRTLTFLQQQLPIMQKALKESEAKLNLYRSTSGKIDLKFQSQYLLTHLSDLDRQLETIHMRKLDLTQRFTQYHPVMLGLTDKQHELAIQRAQVLEQIKKLPAEDQMSASLARDVEVKSNLYMVLLAKINEQQVITAGIISDISVLSLANFADRILVVKPTILACASLIAGGLLACVALLLWQLVNRSRNSAWVSEELAEHGLEEFKKKSS